MPLKSYSQKTMQILSNFVFPHFHGFLLLTFSGAFLKACNNEFEISIKFSVFYTQIDIFSRKKLWDHNSTFCKLYMQMPKKLYISNILQKVKSYFFANIYHSPFDS
jgi:hypothetical protein